METERLLKILSDYITETSGKNIIKVNRALLIQCYGKIKALDIENKLVREVN